MRENREVPAAPVVRAGGGPVGEGYKPYDPYARCWGVGRMRSTCEVPEQGSTGIYRELRRRAWREGVRPRGTSDNHTHRALYRTERVSGDSQRGGAESFPRYSLEAGAVCTKVCSYGSVRGAGSNPCPYRDRTKTFLPLIFADKR